MPKTKRTVAGALAGAPGKIRGLAEFSFVDDAEIGREFSVDLVAQPEAGIDVGKAGADHTDRVGLAVEIDLDLRLQDQPLREQKIVGGFELGGEMALVADIAGEFEIEKVRRETLDAERPPIAGRA